MKIISGETASLLLLGTDFYRVSQEGKYTRGRGLGLITNRIWRIVKDSERIFLHYLLCLHPNLNAELIRSYRTKFHVNNHFASLNRVTFDLYQDELLNYPRLKIRNPTPSISGNLSRRD